MGHLLVKGLYHKVHIYLEYHSVCSLVGIRTSQPSSPARECSLPPEPKGGGAHVPAGEGVGESKLQRLEKKLLRPLSEPQALNESHMEGHNQFLNHTVCRDSSDIYQCLLLISFGKSLFKPPTIIFSAAIQEQVSSPRSSNSERSVSPDMLFSGLFIASI